MAESDLQKTVRELGKGLDELRMAFDLYFEGMERVPPVDRRDKLKVQIRKAREDPQLKNTAVRFQLNQLWAKFMTYDRLWSRCLAEMEAGTFRRDRFKVALRNKKSSNGAQKGEGRDPEEVELDDMDFSIEEEEEGPAPFPQIPLPGVRSDPPSDSERVTAPPYASPPLARPQPPPPAVRPPAPAQPVARPVQPGAVPGTRPITSPAFGTPAPSSPPIGSPVNSPPFGTPAVQRPGVPPQPAAPVVRAPTPAPAPRAAAPSPVFPGASPGAANPGIPRPVSRPGTPPGPTASPVPRAGPSNPSMPAVAPGGAPRGSPSNPFMPAAAPAARVPAGAGPSNPRVPAAPISKPPVASNDISDDQVRVLAQTLAAAKRQVGDRSDTNVDALRAQLSKQIPVIKQQHGAKAVEFKVVIKDGQAVLKAIPKK